ncbi:MAG TPA: hypothetical protein IAC31_02160 [Candidatus Faecousia intestinigallinarum]|nr:hypothetical protein [Candidatus Faecousia intestinigallinarum]
MTIQLTPYSQLAATKLQEELKSFRGDRYGEAIKEHVAATLIQFCKQNEKFAEVVYKTKRTLSDCCREIMQGCGSSISDLEVYRGAVRNYFPNAAVDFHMTITLTGEAPTQEQMDRIPKPPKQQQRKASAQAPRKTVSEPAPKQAESTPNAEQIQLSLF